MFAEILATGDEIRSGALIDSNSAYIAERLEEIGIQVTRHSCVGDDFEALVSIITEISTRVDICVVTGGLGPTTDDLSSEAAASAVTEFKPRYVYPYHYRGRDNGTQDPQEFADMVGAASEVKFGGWYG